MKLICEGLDLSDAINKVSRALPAKAVNPILEGILFSAKGTKLTVYASDTEISIKKTINAEIIEEGSILLPGRFIGEYMRKLSDQQIELFTNEKNQLRIKYGDSEGFVQVLDKNEYPFDEQEKGDYKVKINQKDLKDAIEKTIFSVAQDDTRPVLKGCLMEFEGRRMTVVALDGYRLALVKKPLTQEAEKKNIIVPARSLYEASRLMESQEDEAEMFVTDKHVVFDIKDTEVTARLINGEFVNYRQILPDNYVSNVVINKKQFEESLDRASLPSRQEKNNLVKLEVKEKVITISGTSELSNIKENLNYYIPRKAKWNTEDKCFYFFDNGYGWSMCYAKKYLKRKDRRFWNVHKSWVGGKIRSYLIDEFELKGFKKEIGNCCDGWTEISFTMIEK